jgi:hypothetical protein
MEADFKCLSGASTAREKPDNDEANVGEKNGKLASATVYSTT